MPEETIITEPQKKVIAICTYCNKRNLLKYWKCGICKDWICGGCGHIEIKVNLSNYQMKFNNSINGKYPSSNLKYNYICMNCYNSNRKDIDGLFANERLYFEDIVNIGKVLHKCLEKCGNPWDED